jgi:adsorption protein B
MNIVTSALGALPSFGVLNQFVIKLTAVLITLFFLFGLDDFFVDLYAWLFKTRPKELTPEEVTELGLLPQKNIAVLVAAWKEDGVLKNMIRGNLRSIQYKNYSFFIGVYPNDIATVKEAQEAAAELPNVQVVINPLEGPTCKGQMLNVLIQEVLAREKESIKYDAFVIHDSEDLIHNREFQLVNRELDRFDFIQIPVFSLPVSLKSLVAGVYIDEFAEGHTKLVLVRNHMGVAIPSAGVGTALSRRLVETYLLTSPEGLLNTKSLTEDYELGLSTKKNGFRSKFCCNYIKAANGKKDFIATREYFPKSFHASVRQKSRWTLGIAFQGWENLGWSGSLLDRYFLFRDRKGPFCNFLVTVAFVGFLYALIQESIQPGFLGRLTPNRALLILVYCNLFFMTNRIVQRMRSVQQLYGWRVASISPLRWPLANLIGLLATYSALKQYIRGKISGTAPRWIKTAHELPSDFGHIESLETTPTLAALTVQSSTLTAQPYSVAYSPPVFPLLCPKDIPHTASFEQPLAVDSYNGKNQTLASALAPERNEI